jgi:hypothetical protein
LTKEGLQDEAILEESWGAHRYTFGYLDGSIMLKVKHEPGPIHVSFLINTFDAESKTV